MSVKSHEFKDATGQTWVCRINMFILRDMCRANDLKLKDFYNFTEMNVGSMIGCLWYSCRHLAQALKVTEKEFYTNRVTTEIFFESAMDAFINALTDAFPESEDFPLNPQIPNKTGTPGQSKT